MSFNIKFLNLNKIKINFDSLSNFVQFFFWYGTLATGKSNVVSVVIILCRFFWCMTVFYQSIENDEKSFDKNSSSDISFYPVCMNHFSIIRSCLLAYAFHPQKGLLNSVKMPMLAMCPAPWFWLRHSLGWHQIYRSDIWKYWNEKKWLSL